MANKASGFAIDNESRGRVYRDGKVVFVCENAKSMKDLQERFAAQEAADAEMVEK